MHWFKIHHGYSSDAKLALVAHKMQESRATINGIFIELLEYASKQEERGSLVGYNIEAGALAMGVSDKFMSDVIVTLRNVTLVTPEKVVNWDKYQSGADSTAAERQRRHREKKKQQLEEIVTPVTVTSPLRNTEKSREEKKRKEKKEVAFATPPSVSVEVWEAWMEVRRKKKCEFTGLAYKMILKDLAAWFLEGYNLDKIISASVKGNWTSLYSKPEHKNAAGNSIYAGVEV